MFVDQCCDKGNDHALQQIKRCHGKDYKRSHIFDISVDRITELNDSIQRHTESGAVCRQQEIGIDKTACDRHKDRTGDHGNDGIVFGLMPFINECCWKDQGTADDIISDFSHKSGLSAVQQEVQKNFDQFDERTGGWTKGESTYKNCNFA